jgi:hypothetical protein
MSVRERVAHGARELSLGPGLSVGGTEHLLVLVGARLRGTWLHTSFARCRRGTDPTAQRRACVLRAPYDILRPPF